VARAQLARQRARELEGRIVRLASGSPVTSDDVAESLDALQRAQERGRRAMDSAIRAHADAVTGQRRAAQVLDLVKAIDRKPAVRPGLDLPDDRSVRLHGPAAKSRTQEAPRSARVAREFILANAARPLSIADVAAAAGVGPRALQRSFGAYYGISPLGYHRRVRLQRAHGDLQRADPASGKTVAEVARAWGFTNLGQFAALYRRQFGQLPRQTLHG